jgi:hypothetical protein
MIIGCGMINFGVRTLAPWQQIYLLELTHSEPSKQMYITVVKGERGPYLVVIHVIFLGEVISLLSCGYSKQSLFVHIRICNVCRLKGIVSCSNGSSGGLLHTRIHRSCHPPYHSWEPPASCAPCPCHWHTYRVLWSP